MLDKGLRTISDFLLSEGLHTLFKCKHVPLWLSTVISDAAMFEPKQERKSHILTSLVFGATIGAKMVDFYFHFLSFSFTDTRKMRQEKYGGKKKGEAGSGPEDLAWEWQLLNDLLWARERLAFLPYFPGRM